MCVAIYCNIKYSQQMQAFFLVLDDIQDRSLIRRNQPCWYRHNDIGLAAVNDGTLLESATYFLIRKHFKGKECYIDILETFQNVSEEICLSFNHI